MFDIIAVVVIVGAAVGIAAISLYKSITSRAIGCSCADECPLSQACDPESGECITNTDR